MADQASVSSGAGYSGNGNGGVVGSIADFGNDVATLVELQAKLAALDMKESVRMTVPPLAALVTGLAFVMAALPVLMLGVAWLLASWLTIHVGWAMLLTAGVILTLSILTAAIAARRLGRGLDAFRRSREELARNVSWIRTVLMHSGRPVARRRF